VCCPAAKAGISAGTLIAWSASLFSNLPGAGHERARVPGQAGGVDGRNQHAAAAEREKLEQLADETRQRHERLKATVSGLQESLDYLRLSIKYLVFDLEATRRENNYLRKMLEEGTSNENE